LPVIEEVLELPLDGDYADHLEHKLRPLMKRPCPFLESG
jgi:hypothetical protein